MVALTAAAQFLLGVDLVQVRLKFFLWNWVWASKVLDSDLG